LIWAQKLAQQCHVFESWVTKPSRVIFADAPMAHHSLRMPVRMRVALKVPVSDKPSFEQLLQRLSQSGLKQQSVNMKA